MHGIILHGLKQYLVSEYGRETWDEIQEESEIGPKVYLPVETYPDEELFILVRAAAERTGEPPETLLEAFGRDVTGDLLDTYADEVPAEWDALDLVEGAETGVHTALRTRDAGLDPPELVCRRDDETQVTVFYQSDRQLCPVAKGIIQGVGDRYGETLSTTEPECMYDDDPYCRIVVTR